MNTLKMLLLLQILNVLLIAQSITSVDEFFKTNNIKLSAVQDSSTIDAHSFFPSQVGNFWQYSGNYITTETITKDSLLDNGSRYLYFNKPPFFSPTYSIDTSYNVIFDPYTMDKHLYVLDAVSGYRWWVNTYYEDSVFVEGQIAEVDTIYQGNYLGKQSTFKVFSYYLVYNNSGELEEYWDHDAVLASGIGLVYEDMDAERPKVLIAAIIDGDTLGTIVSVKETSKIIIPSSFTLSQNYPNPFNSTTIVQYEIQESGYYKMIISNILGETIETVESRFLKRGKYKKNINLTNLSSGIYMCTLFNNKMHKTIKMTYLK